MVSVTAKATRLPLHQIDHVLKFVDYLKGFHIEEAYSIITVRGLPFGQRRWQHTQNLVAAVSQEACSSAIKDNALYGWACRYGMLLLNLLT